MLTRKAWGLFLLATVLAAGWIAVNLLAPDLMIGRVPLRLLVMLACDGVVLYGLWRALARADFSPTSRIAAWVGVALILTLWIAAAWTLAAKGIFQRNVVGNLPSLPVAIFLPVLLGSLVLTRSEAVASLLDATPASWLVGIQVYRVLGGVFLIYWIHGTMPGAFALPAGIGDVGTGVLALPAAVWVASGSPNGRRIGIRWNVLGLIDFAVAITMGLLTAPGPAHLLARDHPNQQIATFPTAMVPAFVVPFSTLLHVLSLRQLKRMQSTAAPAREEPVLAHRQTGIGRVAN
jgi:hypothetical protein